MNLRRTPLLSLAVLSLFATPAAAQDSAAAGDSCPESECVMMASQAEDGAQLALALRPDRRQVNPGSTLAFRLEVRNTSETVARDVEVCNELPMPVTVETLFSGGQWRGHAVCWELGDLAAGQRAQRRVRPRVDDDARPGRLRTTASAEGLNALRVRGQASVRVRRASRAQRSL